MGKVTVLGCGLMGVKIAGMMAYHGHRVKMYDNDLTALNNVYQLIEEDRESLQQDGLLTQKNFIGSIFCLSRLEETVADADFIFEAVVDDLTVKQDLLERVSDLCKHDAIIASNTLSCDVTAIAEKTINKERTVGLRFLYPVYYIPEVEITPGKDTAAASINKSNAVRKFMDKMGKTLFFRSAGEPLILTEEQREERKAARIEQINNSSGMTHFFRNLLPSLFHRGSITPSQDDDISSCSVQDKDCAICMASTRDSLLLPCHHMVTCYECSKMLLNRRDGCPICRKDIAQIIKVYHC